MGYVVGEIKTVKRRVSFQPISDDGKKSKADMIVHFRVRDTDVIKERMQALQEYTLEYNRQLALRNRDPNHELDIPIVDFDADFLLEDIENIEGLQDTEKNPLEYSPEILEQILQDRVAKVALIEKWSELNLIDGNDGLKRKN